MAKTATQQASTSQQDETKKQQKKQAKQEAKLMLLVEEQQKALRKAEGKVKKAQAALEEHASQLRSLEEKLAHLRLGQQPASEATNGTYSSDSAHLSDLSTPTEQVDAPPPVEGRTDISSTPTASTSDETDESNTPSEPDESSNTPPSEPSSTPTPEEGDLSIESGGGSIPIVTQDENAWPPPATREEVAEAVVEEETHHTPVEHEVHSSGDAEASKEQGQDNTELEHHYGEA